MSGPVELPLRDIHLPMEPGWWPPAPGWWLLLAIVLLLGWQLLQLLSRRLRRRRRVRLLQDEFARLRRAHPVEQQPKQLLVGYSNLLRRACRQFAPQAVALAGTQWLCFLDDEAPDRPFSQGPGQLLLVGPFQPTVDVEAVRKLAEPIKHRLRTLAEQADD